MRNNELLLLKPKKKTKAILKHIKNCNARNAKFLFKHKATCALGETLLNPMNNSIFSDTEAMD